MPKPRGLCPTMPLPCLNGIWGLLCFSETHSHVYQVCKNNKGCRLCRIQISYNTIAYERNIYRYYFHVSCSDLRIVDLTLEWYQCRCLSSVERCALLSQTTELGWIQCTTFSDRIVWLSNVRLCTLIFDPQWAVCFTVAEVLKYIFSVIWIWWHSIFPFFGNNVSIVVVTAVTTSSCTLLFSNFCHYYSH